MLVKPKISANMLVRNIDATPSQSRTRCDANQCGLSVISLDRGIGNFDSYPVRHCSLAAIAREVTDVPSPRFQLADPPPLKWVHSLGDVVELMSCKRSSESGQVFESFQSTEAFGCLHHAGGGPAQCHRGVSPPLHVATDAAHGPHHVLN